MKLNNARKKGAQNLVALTIIAVCVYLGFKPLTEFVDDPVSSGIVAASLGAAFVIIITMYLLNKQTEIEQESKQGEKLFEEKLKIYWQIFDATEEMLEDGRISKEQEMKKRILYLHTFLCF